ncbi:hypothetical protein [Alkalicoccobacillus gibsonii]|uniref:hypothetical protein n=1 Tax=Alkalicoccobacillus gibsonii TaxID=79881 RepID=UPI0019333A30|nr:hypothetical protein [Alkalicoccobacillus gibsonii]MBM0067976.1 hypothetical protein [Alkalicoccobacillus gibsonii]
MYSQAQESVKSFIFSPKIKWFVIVGVVLFLLATYTQEVLLLGMAAVVLFMGAIVLWYVAKYVLLIGLLFAGIFGFIVIVGFILGVFL